MEEVFVARIVVAAAFALLLGAALMVGTYERVLNPRLKSEIDEGLERERASLQRLQKLQAECVDRVDPSACAHNTRDVAELQAQLDRVQKEQAGLEGQLRTSDVRIRKLSDDHDHWKNRYTALNTEKKALEARLRLSTGQLAELKQQLADMQPDLQILANQLVLEEGQDWTSPDGQISFGIVTVYGNNVAKVRSSALATETNLKAGAHVEHMAGKIRYRVTLTSVDYWGTRVTIDAVREKMD